MNRKYDDLIYYKQDIIDAYSNKRKALGKNDVEDLLRCALLFLEKEIKKPSFTAFEIPNIGYLHKKLDLSKLKEMRKRVQKEDNFLVECAYLDTTVSTPLTMRREMIDIYYPEIIRQELQQIQNDK